KVKQVTILAHDRPELIQNAVGSGARWGIQTEVIAESSELTVEDAAEKYNAAASVMDHLPGLPGRPLFEGYESWYRTLLDWMPVAKTPDRVGMRELSEGIWVGLHGQISSDARLEAPCWIGD